MGSVVGYIERGQTRQLESSRGGGQSKDLEDGRVSGVSQDKDRGIIGCQEIAAGNTGRVGEGGRSRAICSYTGGALCRATVSVSA